MDGGRAHEPLTSSGAMVVGGCWGEELIFFCAVANAPINNLIPMLFQAALIKLIDLLFLNQSRRVTCKEEGVQSMWRVIRENSVGNMIKYSLHMHEKVVHSD